MKRAREKKMVARKKISNRLVDIDNKTIKRIGIRNFRELCMLATREPVHAGADVSTGAVIIIKPNGQLGRNLCLVWGSPHGIVRWSELESVDCEALLGELSPEDRASFSRLPETGSVRVLFVNNSVSFLTIDRWVDPVSATRSNADPWSTYTPPRRYPPGSSPEHDEAMASLTERALAKRLTHVVFSIRPFMRKQLSAQWREHFDALAPPCVESVGLWSIKTVWEIIESIPKMDEASRREALMVLGEPPPEGRFISLTI